MSYNPVVTRVKLHPKGVMTLTKREIAHAIHAAEPAISVGDAVRHADRVLTVLRRRLARGDRAMITNFGAFEVVEHAPRRGVNPATGERMLIPARRAVSFHPAPALLEAING